MTELEKAEEKLRELESILSKGLELGLDSKSLSPIKEEYKAIKDYVDNLKDQANFKEIKENFEKSLLI